MLSHKRRVGARRYFRGFETERAVGEGSAQARTSKAKRCSAPQGDEQVEGPRNTSWLQHVSSAITVNVSDY